MSPGKLAAQVSHASVEATFKSDKKDLDKWLKEGMKKVVLKVEDEKELLKYFKLAKQNNLVVVLIKDAGKTVFKKPTNTCVAIGPDEEGKIDKVTGKLKML